ncbi:MAG: hypothetical protein ACE5FN_04265 [Leptospirillia bacterium]
MANPAEELVALGKARFDDLTAPEEAMLRGAAEGEIAVFANGPNSPDANPENAAEWGPERTVRAEVMRWLCTDREAVKWVDPTGIQLWAAKVVGQIDLRHAEVPFPLSLKHCALPDGFNLQDATLPGLYLDGSHTGPINADRMRVVGGVHLRNGFSAHGAVRLPGASIGGNLDCSGGVFNNKKGDALSADGLKVNGDMSLDDGFSAHGAVRLLGASIGGDLACRGGTFNNGEGDALSADRLKVNGDIFLNNGFSAHGAVRLLGASIGGNLACRGGTFNNKKGDALSADGLKVNRDMFLDDGFSAHGAVRLPGASIGGNLECSSGTFNNKEGDALNAERLNIKGGLFIGHKVSISGTVNLAHATAGVLVDAPKCWPKQGSLVLDGFTYGAIAGNAPTDAKRRLDWLRCQPAGKFLPQPYVQLAKVLKQMGHDDEARKVLIAKEDARLSQGDLKLPAPFFSRKWWQRLWHMTKGKTIAYGHQPFRALGLALLVILLGQSVFMDGDKNDRFVPASPPVLLKNGGIPPAGYPAFQSLVYSVDTFFPIVDLHQEKYWLPEKAHGCFVDQGGTPCSWFYRGYLWFHIAAGWVLTTLFVAGLSGLVRKEE